MRRTEEIIKEILKKRGITEQSDIEEFLSDKPSKTYDPFLLDDMQAGVDLLLSEIKKGTGVCIYGDYDADGVTSVCILSHGLRELCDNFFFYIPSRFDEGYGLNCDAIKRIYERGAGLIITVDCGSVSYEEVEYAKSLGLKVIVTDHHNIDDRIADCIVINPKKKVDKYPFKALAGCGVAFKFLQAVQRQADLSRSILSEALDMVAVGTVGDIVPLLDENRTLVKYGIDRINMGKRKSLKRLAESIAIDKVNSENITYGVVPHINAAGRMASAMTAVNLFMSDDDEVIDSNVQKLLEYNSERKAIQEEAYEECSRYITGDENFIVLRMEHIHEGIAGIVAGKIKENRNRPVIIATPSGEGYLKGTGRSISKINLYDILSNHIEMFEKFGGHSKACGLLMKEENFEDLVKGVNHATELLLESDPDLFRADSVYDTYLNPGEISASLVGEVEKLGPFGAGNPMPRFIMRDVEVKRLSFMGEDGIHARFVASHNDVYNIKNYVNCVLFRKARELSQELTSGAPLDLIGSLSCQSWRGTEQIQFVVEEILQ